MKISLVGTGWAMAAATISGLIVQVMRLTEKEYTRKNFVERYGEIRRRLNCTCP